MKNAIILSILFVCLAMLGCELPKKVEYKTPVKVSEPPKASYPPEVNFLETMNFGDTVYIFIKESGYFNPDHRSYHSSYFTMYTKMVICRVDTFLYKGREYYAVPGGPYQLGPNFEFDTVKFDLQKAIDACGQLPPFCWEKRNDSEYLNRDTCLIRLCCAWKEIERLAWKRFINLGMSDEKYQKWRFQPPSYNELKDWRKSMSANQHPPVWRYEVLSFYKDTCKISYSDHCPVPYSYDYTRVR